jgi:hypothetical protein
MLEPRMAEVLPYDEFTDSSCMCLSLTVPCRELHAVAAANGSISCAECWVHIIPFS